jgi:acyl-CoA thioesterase FadM
MTGNAEPSSVVHSAQIAYHRPALLNDLLTVTAQIRKKLEGLR